MTAESSALAARKRALLARMFRQKGLEPGDDRIRPLQDPATCVPSFAQQRLWFLDQLEPESPRYNVFTTFRLEGHLQVSALEQALTEILRRHETLRTLFQEVQGEPRIEVTPAGPASLPVRDLSALPPPEREREVARLSTEEARRPYSLSEGPLLRTTLVRLAETEHLLLLGMHHIASDAWSVGILTRELCVLYEACSTGQPSPLPELEIQYADFAAWQRQWLDGGALESQLGYWRRQLQALPTLDLPTDRPRPPVQSFRGAWRFRALPPGLLAT